VEEGEFATEGDVLRLVVEEALRGPLEEVIAALLRNAGSASSKARMAASFRPALR